MIPPLDRSTKDDSQRHRLAWASWPADLATPVTLFRSLRGRGHHACLLESVEGPARLARYSFIGVDPTAFFRTSQGAATLRIGDRDESLPGSSIDALRTASRRVWPAPPSAPSHLPPFCGGWLGWFAYEWATELEPRVRRADRDRWGVPDVTLDLYRDVLAVDHASQRIHVVVPCDGGADDHDRAQERISQLAEDAFAPVPATADFAPDEDWRPSMEGDVYRAGVGTLRDAISQGEIFQAVLARRFERSFAGDPFTLYRALRLSNPSPHMFFFEADGRTLVGSSPERLVSVQSGRAEVRPIAGTRPRGADPDEDEALAADLRADAKERAEHDMLVDLARNDLGRVARIGTVAVREYAALERFARVQHLVSRVECELASDRDALDALAACFPAGTVSGAPKVRAMELISGLEPETRGPYAGCFGYLDAAGNLDMAIIIRSFALERDRLTVQAGAGIVFDSVPENEEQETLHKARALFDAVDDARAPTYRDRGGTAASRPGDPSAPGASTPTARGSGASARPAPGDPSSTPPSAGGAGGTTTDSPKTEVPQ